MNNSAQLIQEQLQRFTARKEIHVAGAEPGTAYPADELPGEWAMERGGDNLEVPVDEDEAAAEPGEFSEDPENAGASPESGPLPAKADFADDGNLLLTTEDEATGEAIWEAVDSGYAPAGSAGDGLSETAGGFWGFLGGALAVGGVGLAVSGGGGGGGGVSAGFATLTVTPVAGAFTADVTVTVYSANGVPLGSSDERNTDGNYTIDITGQTGPMLIGVTNKNGASPDYTDEATGADVSLDTPLRAMVLADGGNINATVSPLTELAVRRAGIGDDNVVTTENVQVNDDIAQLFRVDDILGAVTPVTTADEEESGYNKDDGISPAEQYGNVLAQLSGAADFAAGGTTDDEVVDINAMLTTLNAGLQESGDGGLAWNDAATTLLNNGIAAFEDGPNEDLADLDNAIELSPPNFTLTTDSGVAGDGITNSGAITDPTTTPPTDATIEYRVKVDDGDFGSWGSYTTPTTDGAYVVEGRWADGGDPAVTSPSKVISFTLNTTTLTVTPVAGTFTSDVTVTVYGADGTLLGSSNERNSEGNYTIVIGSYTGPMLIGVTNKNGASPDYTDEATGADVNLDTTLRAMTLADGGNISATVSPLTELAVRQAGVPDEPADLTEETFTEESVTTTNTQVAALFGITGDLVTTPVIPVTEDGYAAQDDTGQQYADALALLSGAADAAGGTAGDGNVDIDAMLTTLDAGLQESDANTDGSLSWNETATTLLNDGVTAFEDGPNEDLADLDNTIELSPPDFTLTTDSGVAGDGITNSGAITDPTTTPPTDATMEYRVKVDDGAFGSWGSYTAPATDGSADGAYVVEGRWTDGAGNVSPSKVISFTLDSTAPTLTITSDVDAVNAGQTAEITFAFSETPTGFTAEDIVTTGGTLIDLEVDGSDDTVYTAIFAPTANLASGSASITVAADTYTDVAGNTGAGATGPASAISIDTLPPTIGIITPIEEDDIVSGGEAGDVLMGGTTTGAEEGQEVRVTFTDSEGATVTAYGRVADDDTWTLDGSGADISTLAEGEITVSAEVEDAAGNSATSESTAITYDRTPPEITINTPIEGDGIVSGGEAVDVLVEGTTNAEEGQEVTVTFTDSAGNTTPVPAATATVANDGTWTLLGSEANISDLTPGTITVTANVDDLAGNSATQASVSVDYSMDAPGISIDTLIAGDDVVGIGEDSGVLVSGTTDNVEAGQTVTVTFGDGDVNTADITVEDVPISNGVWTLTDTNISGLAQGTITVTAAVTNAGVSASASREITYDVTRPALDTVTIASSNDDPILASTGNTITVSFTASEELDLAATTVNILGESGITPSQADTHNEVSGDYDYIATHIVEGADAEGPATFAIDFIDVAGNAAEAQITTVIGNTSSVAVDHTPPAIGITPPIEIDDVVDASEDSSVLVEGTTENTEDGRPVTVRFTDSTNATMTREATVTDNSWTLTGLELADISGLAEGEIMVTADVTDAAGNRAPQAYRPIQYDATAEITITGPISTDNIVSGAEANDVLVEGTTTGVEDGQTVTVTFTDSANATVTVTTAVIDDAWTLADSDADANISGLAEGAITVTAEVEDTAGNTATTQASENISYDPAVPSITINATEEDNRVNASEEDAVLVSGTTSAEDSQFVTVTFSDGDINTDDITVGNVAVSNGVWTLADTNISGLAQGAITVTAAVTNAANVTARTSATITHDATAPTIAIDTPIEVDGVVNAGNINAVLVSGTTTGAEAGQTVTVTFSDGDADTDDITVGNVAISDGAWSLADTDISSLADGTITVTADVNDLAGNPRQASAVIELDADAPTLDSVTIASNNTNAAWASTGDTITLDFTASEELAGDPTVSILLGGMETMGAVEVSTSDTDSSNGVDYTATYTVVADDTEGAATFTIDFTDAAGNAGDTVTEADTGSVTVDYTAPTIAITIDPLIEGDGVVDDDEDNHVLIEGTTDAENGQTVTVTFSDGDENTTTDVTAEATVADGAWALAGSELADISTLDEGTITVTADVADAAGNDAIQVSTDIEYDLRPFNVTSVAGRFTSPGRVRVYTEDGELLDESSRMNANGSYRLDIGDYVKAVLVEIFGGRYRDEATGAETALDTPLRAMLVADETSGSINATTSPLTELATRQAGVPNDPTTLTAETFTETSVTNANTGVATLFGITGADLAKTPVIPVTEEGSADQDAAGKKVADALALMSGAAAAADGDAGDDNVNIGSMLNTFANGITETGEGGALELTTDSAVDLLAGGLQAFEAGDNADAADLTVVAESVLDEPVIVSVVPSWGEALSATEDDSDGTITVTTLNVENGQEVTVTFNDNTYTTENNPDANLENGEVVFTVPAAHLALTDGESYPIVANVAIEDANGATITASHDLTRFTVDRTPPELDSVAIASNNANPTLASTGDTITVSFSAKEELDLSATTVDILGQSTTVGEAASYDEASGDYDYTATYTVAGTDTEGAATFAIGFADVAGNAADAPVTAVIGNTSGVTVDYTPPTIEFGTFDDMISGAEDNAVLLSGTTDAEDGQTVTVTFSDGVNADVTAQATVANGAWTLTGSEADISDLAEGRIRARADVADAAGNNANQAIKDIIHDTTAPGITITSDVGAVKTGETATITFAFSETPIGFAAEDIATTGGTLTDLAADGSDDKVYTATFTPDAGFEGSAGITVASGAYTDAAGNDGAAGTTPAITIDTLAPTIDSVTTNWHGDGYLNAAETNSNGVVTIEATGTDGNVRVTLNQITYTGSVDTPFTIPAADLAALTEDLDYTLTVHADDAVGNTVQFVSSTDFKVDTSVPTMEITASDTILGAGETVGLTITFDQSVNDFTVEDITAAGGALSGFAGSGANYTVDFTQSDTGESPSVSVAAGVASDDASNPNLAGAGPMFTLDTGVPTVSITAADTAISAGESTTITITLSETVTGFGVDDITVAGGTLSNFAGSGTGYTVDFTQSGADTPSVSVAAGVVSDTAGNSNLAGASPVFTLDTTAPAVTLSATDVNLSAGETTTVTIAFDESVSGFVVEDITAAGGNLSGFSGSGATYTVNLTQSGAINPSVSVAAGVTGDAAGNLNSAGVSPSFTLDIDPPVITGVTANWQDDGYLDAAEDDADGAVTVTATGANGRDVTITLGDGTYTGMISDTTVDIPVAAADLAALTDGNNYAIAANVSDAAGNAATEISSDSFTVDTTAPAVTGVAITGETGALNNTLNIGDTISITVTMDQDTTVDVTGGTPQLGLGIGGTTVQAGYVSGSGADTLVFDYTIQANQTDANGISIAANSLDANGGALKDAAGNDASLTHAVVIDNSDYKVDTTAPAVTSVAISGETGALNNTLNIGDTISVTVAMDQDTTVDVTGGTPQLGLDIGGTTVQAGYVSGSGTDTLVFDYTIQAGQTDDDGIGINVNSLGLNGGALEDAAGNAASLSHGAVADDDNYLVDTTAPAVNTVAITSATGAQNNTLNAGDTVSVTVTMDQDTTVDTSAGTPQLGLNIGGSTVQAGYVSGSGTDTLVFGYTILDGQTDADGISIDMNSISLNRGTLLDVAGNAANLTHDALAANASYMVDTTAPTVSSVTADWQADAYLDAAEIGSNGTVTVAATGADGQDVTITLDGRTYTGALSGETVAITVAAADLAALAHGVSYTIAANVSDAAGNAATEVSSESFTVDKSILYTFHGDGAGDEFGWSVSGAGDVDNDSYADVIVGAPMDDDGGDNSGSAWIFSGQDYSLIHAANGGAAGGQFGYWVSDAGNVDTSGYDDVVVGAYQESDGIGSGSARLLLFDGEGISPLSPTFTTLSRDTVNVVLPDWLPSGDTTDVGTDGDGDALIIDWNAGTLSYTFDGASVQDFGWSMDNAGNVDNTGRDDVIIGAYSDGSAGSAWIYSGDDRSLLHTFNGDAAGDKFGISVSGAGDVNDDGVDDVIIGASGVNNSTGSASIYSGNGYGLLYTLDGDSAGDGFGSSVSGAGDVNGDGYDDVIVGAPGDDDNGIDAGSAWIFSGQDGGVLYTFHGDAAGDEFGYSVSGAGDVNNDGRDDVVVGAHLDDDNGDDSGSARVLTLDPDMIADPSIVVFDLRDGESSGHSGRTFSDAIAYDIYIVVEPTSASVSAPPAWTMPDGFLFDANDTIHLVADGAIQGLGNNAVAGATYGNFLGLSGAGWMTAAGAAAGLTASGNLIRAHNSDSNAADLWTGVAGGNAALAFAAALPEAILTSQGV